MAAGLPDRAQVVIVGGGIVGCSVAYHLTRRGWRDVLLLEQGSLTGGSTWHAAGLVGQLRATHNMTMLARRSAELYGELEAETGQATGFRRGGSLAVATDRERLEELLRGASMAKTVGVEVHVIEPDEVGERWPLLRTNDLVGGLWIPGDGQTNPVDTTIALAKGARAMGATLVEGVRVSKIDASGGRITGVVTEQGLVAAEHVVICAGMWSRQLGASVGINIPLQACEHFYVVTEPMEGLDPDLPVLRDPGGHSYFKEETGKLLVGFFEPRGKLWNLDGIPDDFKFGTLAEDWDHIGPVFAEAIHRVPALADAGIQMLFNGPESFTPDGRYYLGETPEVRNCYVAAGFNSVGVQSAGGVGWVLADWIIDRQPPMDLWDVDVRRALPFQAEPEFLAARTGESLGLLYAMHWPFLQYESARDVRLSPLHDRLVAARACFGEVLGFERPNWYAPPGMEPVYEYSYGRQNWFEASADEHRAVREAVGLFDQTSFAKFSVTGPDAEAVLNQVCANNVAVAPGNVVYTQWLNERGGIEADLTVTRLGEDDFMVVTAVASQGRDFHRLSSHVLEGAGVKLADVSNDLAVLGVMGPESRNVLAQLTDADLGNEAFPYTTAQRIEIAGVEATALRVTYVGELGWELYVAAGSAVILYDALMEAGEPFGLTLTGFHAMNSLRLEAGYRHWGDDITDEDTPIEAGLSFAVAWDKPGGFIGREALVAQRDEPRRKRLIQLRLEDPKPMLYHDEPIMRDGVVVGRTTSGMYGHTVGSALAMGYVTRDEGVTSDWLQAGTFAIEVATRPIPAAISLRSFYDPRPRVRM